MQTHGRKERERAQRHQLIVSAARELAETEGWDAVTTRRLADRIEYSQPVLYSHFRGKNEIVGAVALDGFTELTTAVRSVVPAGAEPRAAVAALAHTYLDFAEQHPAVYDAMFSLSNGLPFADAATPPQLQEAFAVLRDTLSRVAGSVEPDLFTEVSWAALHGLATLTRAGRLPAEDSASRLEVLVDRLVAG
ncbi:MAG: TetR/AcrR family transcriptional regulator [Nocardioides sp.]|nr:TetR/AcrR family transcriptional regulator [Nocardioides sp.]